MDIKTGYKTTEFWFTLISLVISAITALGLLPQAEGEQLESGLNAIVTGVFAVVPVALYIWSRTRVKAAVHGK